MKVDREFMLSHLSSNELLKSNISYLSAYLIALEGWRRGLTLKWHSRESTSYKGRPDKSNIGRLFSLSNEKRTHFFIGSMGDKNKPDAASNAGCKVKAKELLSSVGLPVPEGKGFNKDATVNEITRVASSLKYPVVLKPTNGTHGNGVFVNIQSEESLIDIIFT